MSVTKKTKICLLVDVRGWAFENIAQKIKSKLEHQFDVDIVYMGDYKRSSELCLRLFWKSRPYGLVHFFWRGALARLFDLNSVANAAASLTAADAEQFLHNIATAIKTTWICDHLFLDSSFESIWMRRALSYVDRYAVSSKILGAIYSDLDGCRSPSMVISDGVDLSMFTAVPRRNRSGDDGILKIGWAGNSEWGRDGTDHKGLASIIKPAIEKLQSEGYAITGHFCDRQQQWTARADMPDYYHAIDIYVCASISEGTPNPILEAMACGLPILSTDVGIVSEALGPQQQEFIVMDRRAPEFLDKLRILVENPTLRGQLGEENIRAIRCWDWQQRITQWELFIVSTLGAVRDKVFAAKQLATLRESISLCGLNYSMASRTQRRDGAHSKRVCLAMMVCNEAAIIRRCLNSVVRYVDQYFILDTGSTDNTGAIIRQTIGHLPGQLESAELTSFDELRLQLFAGASVDADFVLFIDADETLQSISPAWRLDAEIDVGRIEVATPAHSLVQPRLIRAATPLTCNGAYSEIVVFPNHVNQQFLDNVRIQHHADGNRHMNRAALEDEKRYLLGQLELTQDATTYLNLARVYLRLNDTDRARDMLVHSCKINVLGEAGWHAHYLLGLLIETVEADPSGAENHYRLAFELAPDRVEALYRLIRIRIDNKEFATAQRLARIAAEIQIPVHTDYFERRLYEKVIPACLARLAKGSCTKDTGKALANESLEDSAGEVAFLNESKPARLSKSFPDLGKPPESAPKLTIGMATFDDYDGVYFSTMAISLYHSEVLDDIELIVIDNNPGGKCTDALTALCKTLPFARYIAVSEIRGTAVRDSIFVHARGAAVMCIDAHVMLVPNALKRLIDYFDQHPESLDLYQGPLIRDDKANAAFHMSESWNKGMLGVWESDPKMLNTELAPFEIRVQGLGLFACRNVVWPKFNPRFSGFGGEEGYIHEKFRRRGGQVMCLPFLQWIHRFERPLGTHYPNVWEDRIRNYLIGHDELGQDTDALERHFASYVGFTEMANARKKFDEERSRAVYQFDAIFCIKHRLKGDSEPTLQKQLQLLGAAHRVQSIETVADTKCPLSNRFITQTRIVERAQLYGYQRIFIFDERSLFHQNADHILNCVLDELLRQDWDICYFDIDGDNASYTVVNESGHLVSGEPPTGWEENRNCGNVVAINHTGYATFIENAVMSEPQSKKFTDINVFVATSKLATQIDFLENQERPILYIDPAEI